MIIYKITNKITGKVYIGKTVQLLEKRIKGHLRYSTEGKSTKLTNSVNKYKWENFEVGIVEQVDNIEDLNQRERYWIAEYDSYENGLNSTLGGDGGDNSKYINYSNRKSIYTEELREVRRQQLLTNNPNNIPGVREKISQAKLGHIKSSEWVTKIVESKKANGFSWKKENNPNYVEVTKEQEHAILSNLHKVKKKKELVEMTGLSYYMINKVIKSNGSKV